MTFLAKTPFPPYYAVIFTSILPMSSSEYEQTAKKMAELAQEQPGYLGEESTRNSEGHGITISYWDSLDAIQQWKLQVDHQEAQKRGKKEWYLSYHTRICKVERDYSFPI